MKASMNTFARDGATSRRSCRPRRPAGTRRAGSQFPRRLLPCGISGPLRSLRPLVRDGGEHARFLRVAGRLADRGSHAPFRGTLRPAGIQLSAEEFLRLEAPVSPRPPRPASSLGRPGRRGRVLRSPPSPSDAGFSRLERGPPAGLALKLPRPAAIRNGWKHTHQSQNTSRP